MTPLTLHAYQSEGHSEHEALFFHTPLCGTCKLGQQMLEIVEATLETQESIVPFKIHSCRVAEWQSLVQEWQIESVPALALIKNKTLVKKIYAFQSVPYLFDTIKTFLLN